MKKLMIALVFAPIFATAQDTSFTRYDEDWSEIHIDDDDYSYYGKKYQNDSGLWMRFDYFRGGQLQMAGSYQDEDTELKEGLFVYYNDEGDTTSVRSYLNDTLHGLYLVYYESGAIEERSNMHMGFYDGTTFFYHESGEYAAVGVYDKGNKIGKWEYFNEYGESEGIEYHVKEFRTKGGYSLQLPNDRWLHLNWEEPHIKNDDYSYDKLYRRSIVDAKGNGLVMIATTGTVHDISEKRVTAEMVAESNLKNNKLKFKEIREYEGVRFKFKGAIYLYKDRSDGIPTNNFLFVKKKGDKVMYLTFTIHKKAPLWCIEEMAEIVKSIEW